MSSKKNKRFRKKTVPNEDLFRLQSKKKTSFPNRAFHTVNQHPLILSAVVVIVLIIIIVAVPSTRDYFFKSRRQKLFDQTHQIGLIIPKDIQFRQSRIRIRLGKMNSQNIYLSDLKRGVFVKGKTSFGCSEDPFRIFLKLDEQRLYISAKINSLQGNLIGEIQENKWVVKNDDILDYHGDGSMYFEIIDKYKRIPLSIICQGDEIIIKGIFTGKGCIVICNDDALVSNGEAEAIEAGQKIEPLVPFDILETE